MCGFSPIRWESASRAAAPSPSQVGTPAITARKRSGAAAVSDWSTRRGQSSCSVPNQPMRSGASAGASVTSVSRTDSANAASTLFSMMRSGVVVPSQSR